MFTIIITNSANSTHGVCAGFNVEDVHTLCRSPKLLWYTGMRISRGFRVFWPKSLNSAAKFINFIIFVAITTHMVIEHLPFLTLQNVDFGPWMAKINILQVWGTIFDQNLRKIRGLQKFNSHPCVYMLNVDMVLWMHFPLNMRTIIPTPRWISLWSWDTTLIYALLAVSNG